ncbi:MAG: 3-oxoacyl-ACP reductase FabG [Thermoleophilia bacterium]|nr:3-oxoacyl-ACP reductase FabG [Thermoleophilia bacterium]
MVTGASRGIGAACALRLARDGFDVVLTYGSDAAVAQTVAERVRAEGVRAQTTRLSAIRDDPTEVIAAAEQQLGPLDAAVLNAGITRDAPAIRAGGETWREVIDVNLTGTWKVAQAAVRCMRKRRAGTVVVMTSIVGLRGNIGQVNYAASKAALIGMTRSLAKEAAPYGIRVNAVAPGFVATRLTEVLDDDLTQRLLAATPLGRLGEPEDIAGPVAFLCSEGSGYVTGTVVNVDGGLSY